MDARARQILLKQEWAPILKVLAAHAAIWGEVYQIGDSVTIGQAAEDIAQQVVVTALDPESAWNWDSEKPLIPWLKWRVRGLMSDQRKLKKNSKEGVAHPSEDGLQSEKLDSYDAAKDQGAFGEAAGDQAHRMNPEELLIAEEERSQEIQAAKDRFEAYEAANASDDVAALLLQYFLESPDATEQQAADELGLDIKDIKNAKKRMKRRAIPKQGASYEKENTRGSIE